MTTVLVVRFLTELALLAAVAWAGAARTRNVLLGIALGVAAAVVVSAVWGLWIAPTSRRRLPDPARLILELVLFTAAAIGLVYAGRPPVGIAVGISGAVMAVAVRFVGERPAVKDQRPDGTAAPVAERVDASRRPPEKADGETVAPRTETSAPLRRPRGRDRARPRS